jgi:hypothetical protein
MIRPSYAIVPVAFAIFGAWLCFVYSMSAARFFFRSKPLTASVTDQRTGGPIQGAVVVVVWRIDLPLIHGHDHRILYSAQATTDDKGQFQIEGWGPKYSGVFWDMPASSPVAFIFKSGYPLGVASNYSNVFGGFRCTDAKSPDLTSGVVPRQRRHTIVVSWNHCPIPLEAMVEDLDAYTFWISRVHDDLCVYDDSQCTAAVAKYFSEEEQRLIELGAHPGFSERVR